MDGLAEAHLLDADEVDQLIAVLRLGEDHDGANLRDRLSQDRWRQYGTAVGRLIQIALV
jgi:hypothetical protein